MLKVGGADLVRAMIKAADLALPRVPRFNARPPQMQQAAPVPSLVSRQPAPQPELERTRPETVQAQKTITPPAI